MKVLNHLLGERGKNQDHWRQCDWWKEADAMAAGTLGFIIIIYFVKKWKGT